MEKASEHHWDVTPQEALSLRRQLAATVIESSMDNALGNHGCGDSSISDPTLS